MECVGQLLSRCSALALALALAPALLLPADTRREKKGSDSQKLEKVFSLLHQKQSGEGILGANAALSIALSALCSLILL